MKKVLAFLTPLLLTLTSAYGESYGKIIGGIYVDTELIAASIIFIAFFAGILIATRKMNLLKNDMVRIVISMGLSAFAILGLNKMGLDYTKIVVDIGLEKFFIQNMTLIIIALIIIFSIWLGFANTIMGLGGIIFSSGILGAFNENLVYNWEIVLVLGIAVFLIGLWIKNKSKKHSRKKVKSKHKSSDE